MSGWQHPPEPDTSAPAGLSKETLKRHSLRALRQSYDLGKTAVLAESIIDTVDGSQRADSVMALALTYLVLVDFPDDHLSPEDMIDVFSMLMKELLARRR
jgi:hypothetical protein